MANVESELTQPNPLLLNRVKVYIISWPGFHDKALKIANELIQHTSLIKIVYSDHDVADPWQSKTPCETVRRSQDLFFSDKFKACLDDSQLQTMLVIHADAECLDWGQLLEKYQQLSESKLKWGVYAPNIKGSSSELHVSKLGKVANSSYAIVSLTDSIVFGLHPSVIKRLSEVDLSQNIYGWGIDVLFCAISRSFHLFNLVDESVEVTHPKGTGYSVALAKEQAGKFFRVFNSAELIEAQLLLAHIEMRRKKAKSTSYDCS